MNEYQCIFCGEKMDSATQQITSLLVTTNWSVEAEEEDQQVFCHLKCLKEKCKNPENILLEEDK